MDLPILGRVETFRCAFECVGTRGYGAWYRMGRTGYEPIRLTTNELSINGSTHGNHLLQKSRGRTGPGSQRNRIHGL